MMPHVIIRGAETGIMPAAFDMKAALKTRGKTGVPGPFIGTASRERMDIGHIK